MTSPNDDNQKKIVKFVQILLEEEDRSAITPDLIFRKIDQVLTMQPQWGVDLDRNAVTAELIRRFSLWIGNDTTLKNDVGHREWLNAERRRDWKYWQRYEEWLEERLSSTAASGIGKSTDSLLKLLEDPTREGPWDRRGLVVGHVQSGKTSHYTGLICKAADAGYKIIIVLAGLHNNLRSQTQMRLEEGFLGYETLSVGEAGSETGVGLIDGDRDILPHCATNRLENGDFSTKIASHLAISPEQRPWLFVVKKNKSVLKWLLKWVQERVADTAISGVDPKTAANGLPVVRKLVTRLPLLMIDDEADHASVDTGEQSFDENGLPDEEHSPTAINRLIRRILKSFSRSAYVGYTATPFANIFIHDRGTTREEGPDLFPAAFIVNLAAPSNYVGPARVFGHQDGTQKKELPLIRTVDDYAAADGASGWMPTRHKKEHCPLHNGRDEFPPSLGRAIGSFILACAVRRLRGQEREHSSMLVHVTRYTAVQKHVCTQVSGHVRHIRQRLVRRIDQDGVLAELRSVWETDFIPTSCAIHAEDPALAPATSVDWDDIAAVLPEVVDDIEVRMINGTAKDALDYAENCALGLKVIAIGGDKLARGLTLEGLCVSYFLRASKMYDTLMQMGRWFGYRPGYFDLCRLYTTSELVEWFGHIADAAEELREEFDLMEDSGATPRDYGLKVAAHPVLMVTSRVKMRSARTLWLSFSGQLVETVALFRDTTTLAKNFDATKRLVASLGQGVSPIRPRNGQDHNWQGVLWENVPADPVLDFLLNYSTHPDAQKVNSRLLADFIQSMAREGELTNWTVALIGGGEGDPVDLGNGAIAKTLKRKHKTMAANRYSIGRLMSPRDEAIDLDEAAWRAALELTHRTWKADPGRSQNQQLPDAPCGRAIRRVRGLGADGVTGSPDRGVLFLYVLDPKGAEADLPSDAWVAGFGISFPSSRLESSVKVRYEVNTVLWEQEYAN